MLGNWPNYPIHGDDPVLGPTPCHWWGDVDRDGDATPWMEVPAGSIYLYMNGASPTFYVKDATNDADADWGTLDITT